MPSIDNLTPSSSLMLVRDSCDGIQVFMMKRAQKINFGGIWVFPGGIIETKDKEIAKKDFCKNHVDPFLFFAHCIVAIPQQKKGKNKKD